ncbi:MAG: DAK2 domain-containing protein [Acidimicrobiales bacterium]
MGESEPPVGETERLTAAELVSVVRAYRDMLDKHRGAINRLNVYPVPDGDTGTNMALTVGSVLAEVDAAATAAAHAGKELSLKELARCLSHGSLMGARGNSGVILSQVLRGFGDAIAQVSDSQVGAAVLADALKRASDGAYAAVSAPVEGTILTVARAAAEGAHEALLAGGNLHAVATAACEEAKSALSRTTDMLAPLKAAGVVDAGGAGLVLFYESLVWLLTGAPVEPPPAPLGTAQDRQGQARPIEAPPEATVSGRPTSGGPAPGPSASEGEAGVGELRYEVMFFLDAPDESIPAFRSVWASCGGSVVIVGGNGLYNCHIHTDDIGAAIEAAIEIGRPRQVRVTDLREQVEEERWVREAANAPDQEEPPAEPCTCAVVAVCAGEGVRRIFKSLGARGTVHGGQSANPSVAEILQAVDAVPAEQVIVLPNNPNVVPVAEQAAGCSTKKVRVVPTVGVPEGFAALLDYDPESDVDSNAEQMAAAAAKVVAGEVAQASRDAPSDVGPVHAGDWLGMSRQGIRAIAHQPSGPADAAIALLQNLVTDEHEIVTIIEGEGSSATGTRQIVEWLSEHHPSVTAEILHGGQPLYPYLFSIE